MATYTSNYNLKKPDYSDFVDIVDLNGNMDIIDSELNDKINASDVYTKTEADSKLNLKANLADVYTKTQVDDLLESAGGESYSTIVMGTSAAGYTAADVDYLCDGSNDSTQFTAALGALPSTGGQILLLEGTYYPSSVSIAKNNVTFKGMSAATVLSGPTTYSSQSTTLFTITNGTKGLKFDSIVFNGRCGEYDVNPNMYLAENVSASSNPLTINFVDCKIYGFKNPCIKSALTDSIIENSCSEYGGSYYTGYSCITLQSNNIIKGCKDIGFTIDGDNNLISDCNIPQTIDQGTGGFDSFSIEGNYNKISGNTTNAKVVVGTEGSVSSSQYNIVIGNWFTANSFVMSSLTIYGKNIFTLNYYSSDFTINNAGEAYVANNFTIE